MRILHLSTLYPPHVMGGAELSVAMLAEAQLALGHQLTAVCTTPNGFTREVRNGVDVYRLPHESDFWIEDWLSYNKLRRGWRKFMHQFNVRLERSFARVLDEVRPDVVHTHSLVDVTTLVWRAAARRGIPIVHTLRDYDLICASASLYHHGRPCGVGCRLLTALKPIDHRHVGGVAGVSGFTLHTHLARGLFAHVPARNRRVIWNPAVVEGVGPGYVRPDRAGAPLTFGFIGRMTEEKGVFTLIEAARRLPPGGWRLLIAGRSPTGSGAFEAQAAGLPIEFAGWTQPKDFFEAIDTLIVPSIWAEPLPRTILEAYRMGVPAIGARVGGIPDLIGAGAEDWLFPPGDAAALAARMARVLTAGRAAMPDVASFRRVVEETEPALVANRYLDLYESVMADYRRN